MKKVLLFGGTTEGRVLAQQLQNRCDLTVSVVTEVGKEELAGVRCQVFVGPMLPKKMEEVFPQYDLILDATHPYAQQVSKHIQEECTKLRKRVLRLARCESQIENAVFVASCAEAAKYLMNTEGNILIATGAKELQAFACLEKERLYPRVLPTHMGIEACEKLGVAHRNIIAMQGPFSTEMNVAMMRMHDIRFLVTKDGGDVGGFQEKQMAAKAVGAELILVSRPKDDGVSFEKILEEFQEGEV